MNPAAGGYEFEGGQLPPRLKDQPRRGFSPLVLVMLIATVAAAILFFFNPTQHRFYPLCYFHAMTGLHCPGCGSLRAIHHLLHGHILEAARLNLVLLMCLPYLGWLTIRFATARLRGQRTAFAMKPAWLWMFLGVVVVFTVLRNLPGFAWLAP